MGDTVYNYIFNSAGGYDDGLGVGGCHKIQKSFITDPMKKYFPSSISAIPASYSSNSNNGSSSNNDQAYLFHIKGSY